MRTPILLASSFAILAAVALFLPVRPAGGQSGQLTVGNVTMDSNGYSASGIDESGQFRLFLGSGNNLHIVDDLPKPGRVIATSSTAYNGAVLYEDGDVYIRAHHPESPRWLYEGNIFDGPVQTKATTWGRVKAERR